MDNHENKEPEDRVELDNPDILTVLQIIRKAVIQLKDRAAIILWSSFILLTLWGLKGDARMIFPDKWRESLFPNLAWRDQLVSFMTGFVLLVIIPSCIIKFGFKEKLSAFGLGWPRNRVKLGRIAIAATFFIALPLFWLGTFDPAMRAEYPLFQHTAGNLAITTYGEFIIYELFYFVFFLNIEFIFRGYLLFGLFGILDREALPNVGGRRGPLVFGLYAVLIQMLAYTMWHISKPMPEYMGALVWGVAVAAIALKIRSIWPIVIVHWLLNVFLDTMLWLKLLPK
jgi:hypothetical protein